MRVNIKDLEQKLRNYEPKPEMIPFVKELLTYLGFKEFALDMAQKVIELGDQYSQDLRTYLRINQDLLSEKRRISFIDGRPETIRAKINISTRPITTDEIFAEVASINPQGNITYARYTTGVILQARAANDSKSAARRTLDESMRNQQAVDYLLSKLQKVA